MIDTHSHLLPWVDHGSPDLDTSVRMARVAVESGIQTVVCTPHLQEYESGMVQNTREVIDQVRGALAEAEVALDLVLGFEVDLSVAISRSAEELKELTIEGSPGVLVLEMPYHGWPPFLEETLFRLATQGMKPVIAHPERNDRVQKDPEILDSCLKAGAIAQATAASLTGEFGKGPLKAFETLLQRGAVSLLASDAHAYRTDGWTLTPALGSLRGSLSEEELAVLVDENPRRLLSGEPLLKVRSDLGGPSRSRGGLLRRSRGA